MLLKLLRVGWLFFFFGFGSIECSNAQNFDFDLSLKKEQHKIDEILYSGFSTGFKIPVGELQKIWWKYSKKIGIVDNRKSHYLIKIPSPEKGLSSVSLLETSRKEGNGSVLFLAVLDQTNNEFKSQVREVLLEFKIKYYTGLVEEQILKKEKALAEAGGIYTRKITTQLKNGEQVAHKKPSKELDEIMKLSFELENLKKSLNQIKS